MMDITKHYDKLYGLAISLTKDQYLARDLLHDVMLKAMEKPHLFKGGNLPAWLYVIMKRAFFKSMKRQSFDIPIPNKYEYNTHLECQDMIKGIKSLPKKQREALCLKASGYMSKEIAGIEGVPVETIKSRVRYARLKLTKVC